MNVVEVEPTVRFITSCFVLDLRIMAARIIILDYKLLKYKFKKQFRMTITSILRAYQVIVSSRNIISLQSHFSQIISAN